MSVDGSEVVRDKIALKLNRVEKGTALEHAVLDVLDERGSRTDEDADDDGSRGRSMVLAAHEQRARGRLLAGVPLAACSIYLTVRG
ncbi:hypothetical protein [Actinoplanes sp. NPDC020271]|uniref:hypothetical protein n=1 Tax=Actinoplanes sp. NPDC020271 TaxID=3363896 RepID=UPI0037A8A6F8